MTTKQLVTSAIVRLMLTAALLWGAWHECGPFTWTILCLMAATIEFRNLAVWLDRKNNRLANYGLNQAVMARMEGCIGAVIEMRRHNNPKEGDPNDRG